MGTISQLHERVRLAARRIESDEDALASARLLALEFDRLASDRDVNRILPEDELDALSHSGLLGITVPSEYEGLDISNAILAEIVAIVAESDPSIAVVLQGHFHVLEALRVAGSEEQKSVFYGRALAGERMAGTVSPRSQSGQPARLVADGAGYRLDGRQSHSTAVLFSDWIAVAAVDPTEREILSLLPRAAEGIQIIDDWDGFGQRTTGMGTTILHRVHVESDAAIDLTKPYTHPTTIAAVGRIAHAGIDLGIARAAFNVTVDFVKNHARPWMDSGAAQAAGDPLTIARIGQIAIRIEAAAAMIERAGGKLDIAQISPTDENVIAATLSLAGASVLASEIALEASNTLFELSGTSSTRIGLNFDRHWRNARTHTADDPTSRQYSVVGDYLLNGKMPPQKAAF
jgi:SfnB family sulfur acquisition oxidoreductase